MRGLAAAADRAAMAAAVSFLITGYALASAGVGPQATAATPSAAPPPATAVPSTAVASAAAVAPTAAPPPPASPPPPTAAPDDGSLLTFRGDATRTRTGTGPVGEDPALDWTYPSSAMCAASTVGEETTTWCGTGWTGQPAVFERDGRTWVVVGAYDRHIHFVDGDTGEAILPPFPTGDIIKGSVTIDPDGFPIAYSGSRDGAYRAVAFDGDAPRELWRVTAADATGPTQWNDDWDSAGLVVDDHLVIGGENSRLWVARLDRRLGPDGLVALDAEVVADVAAWDEELLAALGDRNTSIETSVAVHDGTVWFASSGGLVQGWDLGSLTGAGEPRRTFRWWMGDDVDATVVVDPGSGDLFVAAEWERHTARAREVGQVVRLDPDRPDDPVVWSVHDPRALEGAAVAGVWATPALHGDLLVVPFTDGRLVGLDAATGATRWERHHGDHLWSSPVITDGVLLQGDCGGAVTALDLGDGGAPPVERWSLHLGGGCVESTPAVAGGRLYVGTRAGHLVAVDLDGATPGR